LGELTALPQAPSWIKGVYRGVEKGKRREWKGREERWGRKKREDPPRYLKCVDANGHEQPK